jgi:hypothetical protein
MAIAQPIVGINSRVDVAPIVSGTIGAYVTLKNSKWSLTIKPSIKEAPNTTDGMLRALGLADYSFSVDGSFDVSQPIEGNLAAGAIVAVKLFRDSSHFWAASAAILGSFKEDTGADDLDTWSFEGMKQSGTLTPPVFP